MKKILTFDVSTPDKAREFLGGKHVCASCLMIGGYCGGSGFDCLTTWEASDLVVAADKADAKTKADAPLMACTDCGGAGLMYGEPTCPRCVGSGYEPTYYTDAKP